MNEIELRTVTVERYLQPLREGGSLPALADADDGFKYVLKFKGAGHGPRMLISELLGGEIARVLGFKVPELVFANLDEYFGQSEADEEILQVHLWMLLRTSLLSLYTFCICPCVCIPPVNDFFIVPKDLFDETQQEQRYSRTTSRISK